MCPEYDLAESPRQNVNQWVVSGSMVRRKKKSNFCVS